MAEGPLGLPQNLRRRAQRLSGVMYWGQALGALAAALWPEVAPTTNRLLLAICGLLLFLGGCANWFLPWHRWPRNRRLILTAYGMALLGIVILATGGAASPFYPVLILPVLVTAAYYGSWTAAIGTLSVLALAALALLTGASLHRVIVFAVLASVVTLAAAFQRLFVQALQRETADKEALYLLSEGRRGELESNYLATLEALSAALDAKDRYSEAHGRETAALCMAVGRRLGCSDDELRYLEYGALLHDIGKIGIPGSILNKPGPLTAEEFAIMRQHPVIGERILAPVPFLAPILPMVRGEHERYDGGGYPDGLKGEAIPLGARIIFACDAFDAMARDRAYRRALSPERALAELRENAGTQFDPRVVAALLAVIAEGATQRPGTAVGSALPWASGGAGEPGAWAQHLDSIQAMGMRLARINRIPEITKQMGEAIVRLIEHDSCRIWMCHDDNLTPVYASGSARPEYQRLSLSPFRVGEGIIGMVAASRQGVLINDANRHPRRRRRTDFDESVLAVPMVFGDELLGVMALVKLGLNQFKADQLRLLTILANQAAVSIANARLHEQLTEDATTDSLTGLLNRRAMQERIHRAVAEEAGGFSLFLADIDALKTLNDRFGHEVGDRALIAVADCIRSQVGAAPAARWGGDEFLVVLPGLTPDLAQERVRGLQRALTAYPLGASPQQRVSIAVGIAHCPTDGTDPGALLAAADRAMYRAKRQRPYDLPRAANV
jgi:diguanylate cyclase (GGDEF)-like protein